MFETNFLESNWYHLAIKNISRAFGKKINHIYAYDFAWCNTPSSNIITKTIYTVYSNQSVYILKHESDGSISISSVVWIIHIVRLPQRVNRILISFSNRFRRTNAVQRSRNRPVFQFAVTVQCSTFEMCLLDKWSDYNFDLHSLTCLSR